jgi:hypothetical protein
MVLAVLWLSLTSLAGFDVLLNLWGMATISDASRENPILRLTVALLFVAALALWLAHSQPGSKG